MTVHAMPTIMPSPDRQHLPSWHTRPKPTGDVASVAQVIKEHRLRAGLSQHGLAIKVGVTASQVSRWERGTAKPAGKNVAALVSILDCEYAELLK